MWRIDPLTKLEEALTLAHIRNQCRLMMTNDQREIPPDEQKKWFEHVYTKQNPLKYRVWLLKENTIIGYFAAKECDEGFYITEGILEERRREGAGTFLLQTMINQEALRSKCLFADIFEDNISSIRLHQKCGFLPYEKVKQNLSGRRITRYYLREHPC